MSKRPTFRYSLMRGLSGCYMPDSHSGPFVGHTRGELASIIRDELAFMEWPKHHIRNIHLRNIWKNIVKYGSSSIHFSIYHRGMVLEFVGLTEEESNQMESENDF
jgi:hypothetical protein